MTLEYGFHRLQRNHNAPLYCKTWNFREHDNFAMFAIIVDREINMPQS
jgi:hypothetical protein